MNSNNKKRLGDLLVDSGKIAPEQLESVLKKQRTSGKKLGELLVEDGFVTESDILDTLEVQLGIPRIILGTAAIDHEAVRLVPASLANKYILIPIGFSNNKLQVVMSDPLNFFALDDIKISSGYEIDLLIATKEEIKTAIEKFYSNQFVQKAAEELYREQSSRDGSDGEEAEDNNDLKNAPAVRMIDTIINNAVKARASDIHMEPFEKYVVVRYRIDGELQEMFKSPSETQSALVTRVKILANLNIAEKRIPQDGRIVTKVGNKDIDLRVSILPTVHGEKVVIRILSKDAHLVDKKKLGMLDDDLIKLEKIIQSPYGIILVTGPTGSGKSTTLYAVLKELNTKDKNTITVEDPVEYMMDGINQVNVNVKAGLTFAAGLRSILRQDPDIIMIGEIRDGETAEIAIRSAITGHLVLSTIHTNDAPSAVVRLVDMGIESYLVATSLTGVVAQRLVRKICPHCKKEYLANEREKKMLGIKESDNLKLYKGAGCSQCNSSGYVGRVGVYEIMEIDSEIRNGIMTNISTDELRDIAVRNGMKTLKDSCGRLVLKGITTTDELARIAFIKE